MAGLTVVRPRHDDGRRQALDGHSDGESRRFPGRDEARGGAARATAYKS
jgi:hypothetical protein